jgi:ABC transport system ATP-binding/permease protein
MERLAQLLIEQGPRMGECIDLPELPAVIGRLPSAEVRIDDERISRMHARISRRGGGFVIEDLGSSNGTFVNGQRLTAAQPLQDGDQVGLGPNIRLRFALPSPAGRPDATVVMPAGQRAPSRLDPVAATMVQPAEAASLAGHQVAPRPEPPATEPPHLIVTMADGTSSRHALTVAEMSIGRASDNDIVVDSPVVSRQHFRLARRAEGYVLEPLPSASNPVRLAGRSLAKAEPLRDGIELTIGHTLPEHQVTFRYETPAAASEATRFMPAQTQFVSRPPEAGPAAADAGAENQTLIGQAMPSGPETPPLLVVTVAGQPPQTHSLSEGEVAIGRAPDNGVVIPHEAVSRYHARLKWLHDGYELIPSDKATNPLYLDGKLVSEPMRLHHGSRLRIGSAHAGELVSLVYLLPGEEDGAVAPQTILFEEKTLLAIGRDKSNDIVLSAPSVSRFHAQVERVGQRYRLRDLRSSNGTFVNGQAAEGDVWLKPGDNVRIGPYRFVLGVDRLTEYDESHGLRVEAVGLNKWVRKDLNILQDISLVFRPCEFVVVVGQSGGGKSTLVDAIAGYRPASHGRVYVNEVDVYANFDAIRSNIGFVPQKDIIHMELTVYQALDYAAQLRMPPDTSREERHRRVMEVLEDLDLAHRKDVQVSGLSGGQQKRVSIGVELLTKPGLFFLDEPTSGLDPGTETALMQLMRRLADQGRTIILVTHATKNVMLADKVVFLARGGYLAWFGPPEEALAYFDQYRTDRERRTKEIEFDDIYNLLDDPAQGTAVEWAERFRQHPAYRDYVDQPLDKRQKPESRPAAAPARVRRPQQISGLRQFLVLSARNLKILTRDRFSLALMLLAAPIISSLDFVLASGMGRNPFAFLDGDMNKVIVSLIVLTNNAILVGGLSQMRELVKERDIYRRERLVNLRIIPYIMSKLWIAIVLALYMAGVFVLIRHLAFQMPGGSQEVLFIYVTMFLLITAGMMLGLFASALAPNSNTAPLLLILFLIPQIVLSGAMVPLPSAATSPASSRWAFQAIMAITGGGSDVARDVCWELPEEEKKLMTTAFKNQHCNCMGTNVVRQESCAFPGVGELYDEAIDKPDPAEPVLRAQEPGAFVLPPEPERPADPNDALALQQYLQALLAYNDTVTQLRQAYEGELATYRVEQELHQVRLAAYQADLAELELLRAAASGSAEARIGFFYDDYGWTFVDKSDDAAYLRTLLTAWAAQLTIILVLFTGTIIMQKRRDVA